MTISFHLRFDFTFETIGIGVVRRGREGGRLQWNENLSTTNT